MAAFKKFKQTNLKNHNVKNISQVPEIIEKIKQTYFNKTGFEHPLQNPEVLEKMKISQEKTFNEKYGGHPMKTQTTVDNFKKSLLHNAA